MSSGIYPGKRRFRFLSSPRNGSVLDFDTLSPLQRTSASVLDDKGRVLQSAVPQIAPVNYQYLQTVM